MMTGLGLFLSVFLFSTSSAGAWSPTGRPYWEPALARRHRGELNLAATLFNGPLNEIDIREAILHQKNDLCLLRPSLLSSPSCSGQYSEPGGVSKAWSGHP